MNLLNAQARMTEGLRQRLDGKQISTKFKLRFWNISMERAKLSPADSLGVAFNRQAKFWNNGCMIAKAGEPMVQLRIGPKCMSLNE
jgi:hypothetical protein